MTIVAYMILRFALQANSADALVQVICDGFDPRGGDSVDNRVINKTGAVALSPQRSPRE